MSKTTLENNLEVIKKIMPGAYDIIKNSQQEEWYTLIQSKDAHKTPNLLIQTGTHSSALYDMETPKKLLYELVKTLPLGKTDATVIVGIGLGYLLRAVINKMERGHHIIVVEPCFHLIKLTLEKYNLAKYLLNGTVTLASTVGDVKGLLNAIGERVIDNWNTLESGYTSNIPEKYLELTNITKAVLNQIRCNVSTVMGNGFLMAENDIVNLPYVIRHRGVIELFQKYKGKPAVIVSTGPSLVKNIHLLKEAQDNCIIISVGQALRILTGYDIKPDFICTVDFGKVNMDHFKGIMDSKVPLVAINRTYGKLLKSWMGPKFIVETSMDCTKKTAANALQGKGALDQGGSVAHMCLSFARALGCNPITFIGQDLALSDGQSHIAQVDSGGEVSVENGLILWKVKDPNSSINKEGEKETISSMGPAVYKDGYFGGTVLTNLGLDSFLASFEGLVSAYVDTKIMNSTCGGAMIKGTKRITLQDYLSKYCKEKIDKSILEPLLSLDPNHMKSIEEAIPLLETDIVNLKKIKSHSKKGLEYNDKVMDNLKAEEKVVKPIIEKSFTHTTIVFEESKNNPLIMLAIYNENRKVQGKELNIKSDWKTILRDRKKLEISTKRNRLILEATKKESENLLGKYEETFALIKKYKETQDEKLLVTQEIEEITLKDSEDYFKVENWAHPLIDARRVLGKANEYFYPLKFKPSLSDNHKDLLEKAERVEEEAISMREKSIREVEKKYSNDELKKLIRYIELVEVSKEEGKKGVKENELLEERIMKERKKVIGVTNEKEELERIYKEAEKERIEIFKDTFEMIEEAIELYPDKLEAKWGLATTLQFMYRFTDSIEEYKKLVKEYPDYIRLHFEMSQVYVMKAMKDNNEEDFKTGIDVFDKEVGSKSKEFDSFLLRISQILFNKQQWKRSLEAIERYCKKYPHNFEALVLKSKCFEKLGKDKEAKKAMDEAKRINPNIEKILKEAK